MPIPAYDLKVFTAPDGECIGRFSSVAVASPKESRSVLYITGNSEAEVMDKADEFARKAYEWAIAQTALTEGRRVRLKAAREIRAERAKGIAK